MAKTWTGGCTCGAIRYEVEGDPMTNVICHCKNCQKTSGAAFSVNVIVAADKIKVTGTPTTFNNPGDSGSNVVRSFCGKCGGSLFSDLEKAPAIRIVKAGSIDDASVIPKPARQVFCDSRQDWFDPSSLAGVEQVAKN